MHDQSIRRGAAKTAIVNPYSLNIPGCLNKAFFLTLAEALA
jgi:hypothetical protein